MARGQHLSPHQKGIVKRYYEHKDTLAVQKLGEIVSELYLCADPKKANRLWQSVHKALVNADANRAFVDKLMKDRDVERLATYLGELF
ncbi:MAG: hypothetical protein GXP25_15140 [Planctomycetes bacterium]|nr:hypothetical protein [Planctomycetota bacterium]